MPLYHFQKLDENSSEHSRWEHDLLFLRQQLQASATRDIQHGLAQSGAETLAIEGELAQVCVVFECGLVVSMWNYEHS